MKRDRLSKEHIAGILKEPEALAAAPSPLGTRVARELNRPVMELGKQARAECLHRELRRPAPG